MYAWVSFSALCHLNASSICQCRLLHCCLQVDWIKALPGGAETDFVLVSCAGATRPGERVDGRVAASFDQSGSDGSA